MADRMITATKVLHCTFIAGLAVLAWVAASSGLAMAARKANPTLAARLAPGNALVDTEFARQALLTDRAMAVAAAERALRRDATRASAAGVLGLASAQAGNRERGKALLAYSEALTRRDLQVHLWSIELAAERGDIAQTLHHYDFALRVNRTAPNMLFPILAGAITDPLIRTPLAGLLRDELPWKDGFLEFLRVRSNDQAAAGQLMKDILARGGRLPPAVRDGMIGNLLQVREFDLAWALYLSAHPRERRDGVRNGAFEASAEVTSTPLDWNLGDLGDARAEIVGATSGNALQLITEGGGGVVAWQRLLMPVGAYTLAAHVGPAEGIDPGTGTLTIGCLNSGAQLATVQLTMRAGDVRVRLVVPAGCEAQTLNLAVDPGAGGTPRAILVDRIAIVDNR